MSTKIKRGASAKRKAPVRRGGRKPARKPLINQILARLPFTDRQLQRAATAGVLAIIAGIALGTAQFFGIPAAVGQEIALAAGRAGFEVKRVEVRNVDKMNELAVYEIVLAEKDRSMMLVDLDQLRTDLTAFGWIADARVSRQLPDTLIVDIVERTPHAVWQKGDKLVLIDRNGVTLEPVEAGTDLGLMRVAGKDANTKIAELERLLDAAPALKPLVEEAEWIGNRRWNLTFDSGEVLALPEGKDLSAAALVDFARMDGVSRLLGRGVTYFDLRDPERAYLRKPRAAPAPTPAKETASDDSASDDGEELAQAEGTQE